MTGVRVLAPQGYGKPVAERVFPTADGWQIVGVESHLQIVAPDSSGRKVLAVIAGGTWTVVEHVDGEPQHSPIAQLSEEHDTMLRDGLSAAQTLATLHQTGELDVTRFPALRALLNDHHVAIPQLEGSDRG